jgi:hypothetical protein
MTKIIKMHLCKYKFMLRRNEEKTAVLKRLFGVKKQQEEESV